MRFDMLFILFLDSLLFTQVAGYVLGPQLECSQWWVDGSKHSRCVDGALEIQCNKKATAVYYYLATTQSDNWISVEFKSRRTGIVPDDGFWGVKVYTESANQAQGNIWSISNNSTTQMKKIEQLAHVTIALMCNKMYGSVLFEKFEMRMLALENKKQTCARPNTQNKMFVRSFSFGDISYRRKCLVALISHASENRMRFLLGNLDMWLNIQNGMCASVSIWTHRNRFKSVIQKLMDHFEQHYTNVLIDVSMVDSNGAYPINRMRNKAIEAASAPYVFLTDADTFPAGSILTDFNSALLNNDTLGHNVYVVPAFQEQKGLRNCLKLSRSNIKDSIFKWFKSGIVEQFKKHTQPKGHEATNYQKWFEFGDLYSIDYTSQYEPYIIIAREAAVFDERFSGYGWNKVSFIQNISRTFTFSVLPNSWVIHCAHEKSEYSQSFVYDADTRLKNRALMFKWKGEHSKF